MSHVTVAAVPIYATVKLMHRQEVHQLRKHQSSQMHMPFPPRFFGVLWPKMGFQIDNNLLGSIFQLFPCVIPYPVDFYRTAVMRDIMLTNEDGKHFFFENIVNTLELLPSNLFFKMGEGNACLT